MTGFWKLFGATALAVALALLVNSLLASRALSGAVDAQLERRLRTEAALLRQALRPELATGDEAALGAQVRELAMTLDDLRLTVVAADGRVLADSQADPRLMDNHATRTEILAALEPGNAPRVRLSRTVHAELVYFALPVEADGRLLGFVRLAVPLADVHAERRALSRAVMGAGALALLVGALAALLLARSVRRPLDELVLHVAALERGQPPPPLSEALRGDLSGLARAIASMTRELGERYDRILRDRTEILAIVGSMAEGVLAVDVRQRVTLLNPAAARLLDTSEERARGLPVWEVTRVPEVADLLARCQRTGSPAFLELLLPGGPHDRVLRLAAAPLRGGQDIFGSVLVLQDLTGMRRLESVRRDFVVNVSHELKTPLTALRGFLDATLDDPGLEEPLRRRFLGRAREATERMIAIVGDLLALARAESVEHAGRNQALDLRELAAEGQAHAADLAALRGSQLQLDVPGAPVPVSGDRTELLTAIDNLLDNALRHGPQGGRVKVRAGLEAGEAVLEVEDHGPGIPAAEQERVWERFYRVDKSRSRELGGTGLGLSIVRNVALAHGGRVSLDSEVGHGSTFRIHLPVRGEGGPDVSSGALPVASP
jgi:two-component system phosphate regulon sensor histidine kinase PhoR